MDWTLRLVFRLVGIAAVLHALGCDDDDDKRSRDGGVRQPDKHHERARPYPGSDLQRPPAPAEGSACEAARENVQTVDRAMFPDRKKSPSFGYSFKVYPGLDPEAPTVIYVPGGPGSTSIAAERDADLLPQVPAEYTVIATDPRGAGCNAPPAPDYYPDEFYRSEYLADDILAIVAHLELDDYLLYGLSYGTMLSTLVASRAEARDITPPKAVLLEGVFGRAFSSEVPESYEAFRDRFRDTLAGLPASVSEQFESTPLPFDFSPEEWGTIVENTLPIAALPNTGELSLLQALLAYFQPGLDAATVEMGKAQLTALSKSAHGDEFGLRIHHALTCHELAESDFESLKLDDGEVIPAALDCEDVELDRPFSAADWPIRAPIYYLSGTADPNTPPWQAQFHFESQTRAARTLVHVQRAGHNPFQGNLMGDGSCLSPLWDAIHSGMGFEDAVTACGWPIEIESAFPE